MFRMIATVFLIIASAALTVIGQSRAFDIVIRGGRVVDGTGSPWFVADIGIKGDSIAAVATHLDPAGAKVIDATDSWWLQATSILIRSLRLAGQEFSVCPVRKTTFVRA